jgi:membrane protein DedA with SNARE-associated domain
MENSPVATAASQSSGKRKHILGFLFFGGIIAACVLIAFHWEYIIRFQKFGYAGLFVVTVISGFSIPVPVPYMVFTFTLGGVLQPALVGAVAGAGLGIGGTLLYLAGRGGRRFLPLPRINFTDPADEAYSSRWSRFLRRIKLPKIMQFTQRRGTLAVFILSVLPNPFFTAVAISMGSLRFRLAKFAFACWAGQTAKTMAIAYLGYLGLGSFMRWLGAFGVS